MKRHRRRWETSVLALLACCAVQSAFGLGLRTKFAEVSVQNLKIGQTCSLADMVNFPLRILNTGTETVALKTQVVGPQPDELKPGYEPILDTRWVSLQRSTFTVPPGREAVTDVLISIPNDPGLLGRKFMVYLWTRSDNAGALGVGLKSRLLIKVSGLRPSKNELEKKSARKHLADLNFSLSPMDVAVSGVQAGRRVALKDLHAAIELHNRNLKARTFGLKSVPVRETEILLPAGYEELPDPRWLEINHPLVKAGRNSIRTLDLALSIPGENRFKGKKYLALLRVEILGQKIAAYAYAKIFIETQP